MHNVFSLPCLQTNIQTNHLSDKDNGGTHTVDNSKYQVRYQKKGAMTKQIATQSRPESRYNDTLQHYDLYYYTLSHIQETAENY